MHGHLNIFMEKVMSKSIAWFKRISARKQNLSGTREPGRKTDSTEQVGYLKIAFPPPTLQQPMHGDTPPVRVAASLVPRNQVDTYIAVTEGGRVLACNGHVDLGTGLRTAFAQIVADELDVPFASVDMVMGDTDRTPDQGPTTASASIQSAAIPMRRAAAQARLFLLGRAAKRMNVSIEQLTVTDGIVSAGDEIQSLSYGELLVGEKFELFIDTDVPLKDPSKYRIVGRSVARVDIPAKVTGGLTYVHDLRLPGMLHARVVRPPYGGRDSGPDIGTSLRSIDLASISHIPGIEKVVSIGDFVAVVACREEHAVKAARTLRVQWKMPELLPDMTDLAATLCAVPDKLRPLKQLGDIEAVLAKESGLLHATYLWPYQMHGSIGPSCAVADYADGKLTVWSGTQNPHFLHADLAALLDMPPDMIRVVRMEASGCYGRNCADDAAGEAALLARAIGKPVRLQFMREEEHVWEPKGTAQLMDVQGGLTQKNTLAYDFSSRYPSNNAPLLVFAQTGRQPADPIVEHKGDRTVVPQYRIDDLRVVVRDMPPIVRAAWMRGVSALPNVFGHESFIDEIAAQHQEDPVAFRLRFMENQRAIALVKALAEHAGWDPGVRPHRRVAHSERHSIFRGRGFAQHQYVHGTFPGQGAAWCAWICDVEVNVKTGVIRVLKVWAGSDCGLIVNPAGVRHQMHGNIVQSVSRALKERVIFDRIGVVSKEWGGYPILTFTEIPEIDVLLMPGEGHPPLGVGESASIPSAAAIANAVFNATGMRLREVPFTPDRVRAAWAALG